MEPFKIQRTVKDNWQGRNNNELVDVGPGPADHVLQGVIFFGVHVVKFFVCLGFGDGYEIYFKFSQWFNAIA